MTHQFEPQLHPVEIAKLRPTQMTVGLREVSIKRTEWRDRAERDGRDFLGHHMVPVVIGPKQKLYVVDHHHLVRALQEEGVEHILTSVIANLSLLEKSEFWAVMDHRNWIYPFDAHGNRRPREEIPKKVGDLVDDPYRSLAGALRLVGGYAKDANPYSEFLWADFLRRRIAPKVVDGDFDAALHRALVLAQQASANYLPGWCGQRDEDKPTNG